MFSFLAVVPFWEALPAERAKSTFVISSVRSLRFKLFLDSEHHSYLLKEAANGPPNIRRFSFADGSLQASVESGPDKFDSSKSPDRVIPNARVFSTGRRDLASILSAPREILRCA